MTYPLAGAEDKDEEIEEKLPTATAKSSYLIVYFDRNSNSNSSSSSPEDESEVVEEISSTLRKQQRNIRNHQDCNSLICSVFEKHQSQNKETRERERERKRITKELQSAFEEALSRDICAESDGPEEHAKDSWSFLSAWNALSIPFRILRSMRRNKN